MSNITKRALEASLKKLMLHRPINKITIQDITDDCGVNRATFYYHFKDIYDLIEWSFAESAKAVIAEQKHYANWQQAVLHIFQLVEENKPFIINVYRHVSHDQIQQYLYPLMRQPLLELVRELAQPQTWSEEDITFLVDFYLYAFLGIMLSWIGQGMRENPQDIVDRLSRVIDSDMSRTLLTHFHE